MSLVISDRVRERLAHEEVIWLATVRLDGAPSVTPVWFLWEDGEFLIYSEPATPKVRNIEGNPRVSLHLNSDPHGEDVVIIEGTARIEPSRPGVADVPDYVAKYRAGIHRIGFTVASMTRDYSTPIVVAARRIRSW